MIRAIAVISCLIASLFLVPVQGDCNEISESELETEMECCVFINSQSQSKTEEVNPKLLSSSISDKHLDLTPVKPKLYVPHRSARILNCVFRE